MINIKVKERVFKKKRDDYKSMTRKKQKLRNYFRSELISSTTHGLPYIVNTELHWIERVFWVICFASSTGLVFYVLASQYLRFIETPIVMSVEMDYFNWNVSYPAFTLCPALKPNPEAFRDLVNQTSERMGENLESYLWSILAASMDTLNMLDLQSPKILPLIDPNQYALIAAMVFKQFNYQSTTTNTNWPINVDQAMTENGMCHVLNSNVASFDNPTEWGNGMKKPYRKNNIELSFHDKNFFTQIIDYSQIYQVFIHSPDETILTTSPSYTLSLKGFMSFGVQVWSTKISDELRLAPMRLRRCRFINEPISDRYPIYSYNHCMLECKIKMIIELCGCIPHFYKPLDHERICNLGELQCVLDHKKEISTLSASEATLMEFPNSQALPRSPRDCECISTCETDVYLKESESFEPQTLYSSLRIGISSFPKVRVVRDFIFSFYDVILRSGGVVNLCIGTSLLSLVELFMTVIRIPLRNVGQAFKRLIGKIRK